MSLLNVSLEHMAWDKPEPVYLETDRGASQEQRGRLSSLDFIPIAKRRDISTGEQASSGGVYTSAHTRWHLPAVLLTPGVQPKSGDVIIDASQTRWTVETANLQRLGQRWELVCINLIIAHGLRDTIDVQRAAISHDAAGAPVKTFPPAGGVVAYRNLPCRVQLLSEEIAEERGIRGAKRKYAITVDRQIIIDTEDRIVWKGQVLDIVGYRNPELINDLPVIDALGKP